MAERFNSQRTLYRATYVPTRLSPQMEESAATPGAPTSGHVMAKVAFIRGLNIRPAEFAKLEGAIAIPSAGRSIAQATPSMLDVVKSVTTNLSPRLMATDGAFLRDAVGPQLESIGRQVVQLRQAAIGDIDQLLHAIRLAYAEKSGIAEHLVPMATALTWAYQTGLPELIELLAVIKQSTPSTLVSGLGDAQSLLDRITFLLKEASATQALIDDFLLGFTFEPVGRIHLERMEMVPVGIEHGELLYSVPLTPKETVNITHREWSETTSTFESLVQDSFEGFSELGVAEKTDIASSASNETKHSSSFDANASVNFGYNGGPYSLTTSAAVDYGTKSDDATSMKDSRAHSMAITRMASARTRKDHKQSFRVSSVAGAEDLSVRVLTNPSDTQPMRIDYFRLMRKWQVDLIRYGLRMTYDLVIPNPGNALASKVLELESLKKIINTDYQFPLKVTDIQPDNHQYQDLANQFGVAVDEPPQPPGDMSQAMALQKTDDQWMFASMQYNIPDDFEVDSARIWSQYYFTGDGAKKLWFGVRDGAYQPDQSQPVAAYDSDNPAVDPSHLFSKSLQGRSGQLTIDYMWYHVDNGDVTTVIKLRPRAATIEKWRMSTWETLRKAGEDAFAAQLNALKDRKAQLEQEIASYDALTLRRMEREEIMRLVLVWLFGPSFQLVPTMFELLALTESLTPTPDRPPELALDPALMTLSDWTTIRKYGEFIKYIQNAIEWENVLFFSYPYFWDLVENWPFKRFLVHPDFDHRTFLRAGCARVVVTIRPGFECSFAQLVEHFTLPSTPTGDPNDCKKELGADHPYVQIGDEIRNFAMTNYEHVPPANPDRNVRPLLHPLQVRAWSEMQQIMASLEAYKSANQEYPASLSALPDAATLPLSDPWGRPYLYKAPGDHGDYDLVTYGAAGEPGLDGPGLDAHITSWAEGNVVGRWFEYTPTGGLDVGINLTLPTKVDPA